jgi:hypothetical protein
MTGSFALSQGVRCHRVCRVYERDRDWRGSVLIGAA